MQSDKNLVVEMNSLETVLDNILGNSLLANTDESLRRELLRKITHLSRMLSSSSEDTIVFKHKNDSSNMKIENISNDTLLDIVMQQNACLEMEVNKLLTELADVTKGIIKRGYLYKWRDREMSYASKWGLRFFELKGSSLSYFEDDNDNRRPRRTIDLSNCIVRNEGTKRSGLYHIFSIYLADAVKCERGPTGGVLLRLSSENAAEAEQWMDMLHQACHLSDKSLSSVPSTKSSLTSRPLTSQSCSQLASSPSSPSSPPPVTEEDKALLAQMKIDSVAHTLHKSSSRRTISHSQFLSEGEDVAARTSPGSKLTVTLPLVTGSHQHSHDMPSSPSKAKHTRFNPKSYPASKPIHVKSMPSPLSSDVRPGEQNYRGFFHLGLIIFIITHFRIVSDNITKYGFLVRLPGLEMGSLSLSFSLTGTGVQSCSNTLNSCISDMTPLFTSLLVWGSIVMLPYLIERTAVSSPRLSEKHILVANTMVGVFNLALPVVGVWTSRSHPLGCMLFLFQSVILWMKMISYVHVNRDLRLANQLLLQSEARESPHINNSISLAEDVKGSQKSVSSSDTRPGTDSQKHMTAIAADGAVKKRLNQSTKEIFDMEPPLLQYPHNITLSNILYLCIIPTLCYQLNYPRSPTIRWKYILTILIRLVCVTMIMIFFVEQYIVPNLEKSLIPMQQKDIPGLLLRLSKLCIPSTYVWLLGFYGYFHLWMNLLAELTRFGDRLFYKDWWNARTIDVYWRNWNLPVHHWLLRHIYYPMLRGGWSKRIAIFATFFFSAAAHELIISVPFRRVSLHAFLGMLAQAPLIYVTRWIDKIFDNALLGNVSFWLMFCIFGQPMGIIMYYYDIWRDMQK